VFSKRAYKKKIEFNMSSVTTLIGKGLMNTGKLIKGQKLHICRCILYLDLEAKTKCEVTDTHVFRENNSGHNIKGFIIIYNFM
jgi:hypothetical protein